MPASLIFVYINLIMITLKPLNLDNFWELSQLKIGGEQERYIPDNLFLMAMSKVLPGSEPLGVYDGDLPVGFLLHGPDAAEDAHWIHIMMIDESRQGKGYGKAAFLKLLEEIKRNRKVRRVLLAVNKGNAGAVAIYEKLGFRFNGQRFDEREWAVKVYRNLLNEEYLMELAC